MAVLGAEVWIAAYAAMTAGECFALGAWLAALFWLAFAAAGGIGVVADRLWCVVIVAPPKSLAG